MNHSKIVVHLIECGFEIDNVKAHYILADNLTPPEAEAIFDAVQNMRMDINVAAASLMSEREAMTQRQALLQVDKENQPSVYVAQALLALARNHTDLACELRGNKMRVMSSNPKKLRHITQICGLPTSAVCSEGMYYYDFTVGEP